MKAIWVHLSKAGFSCCWKNFLTHGNSEILLMNLQIEFCVISFGNEINLKKLNHLEKGTTNGYIF